MITNDQLQRISQALPVLKDATSQLVREFQQAAFLAKIPAGYDVFLEGDSVDAIALLISGVVRVYKIGETGREITEKDAEAVMIPADKFRDWVKHYDAWREFVFELLSDRLSTVMAVVDQVVFQRMDRRVASLLLNKSKVTNPISVTHQEIAAELGSSREVISRILEDFSQKGVVEVGRGAVEILDLEGLADCAVV